MVDMWNCPKCGTENEEADPRCQKCGTTLDNDEE